MLDVRERPRKDLSPVSPAVLGLSPVLPGTEFFNGDKDLRGLFRFVPGVPGKKEQEPKENAPRRVTGRGFLAPGVGLAACPLT